ncbi:MAG: diguanylate cyclase [Oscillospiraceae bacterium]|nr:diguanylate cyclase [Oscillospiraceae bacterium]
MASTVMSAMLITGFVMTGSVIIAILSDRHENALREFAVLGLFCALLCLISYYMELNTPDFHAKIDAVKFGYLGRVFVNPLLLMLVLRYYNSRVSPLIQALLFAVPVIALCLVFTCDQNRLYYESLRLSPEGLLQIEPGPFYYIYMGYNTLLAISYLGFCLYHRAGLRKREKRNNTVLLSACLIPFLTLLIYLAGLTHDYDISNIGLMIGALLIADSIFRYGLLNKEEMLQNMATGLIFLDQENRLVYANKAALQIIPALSSRSIQTGQTDLGQLCEPMYSAIQVGQTSYQRKITEWSSGDGQHGKLLTFDDITEIRSRLNRDAMTGLLNHATFYPMLDDSMSELTRSRKPLTVSIADIDSFKLINDTYGHANGDKILVALADTLQDICGMHGDVFRYGGEEFAVIFRCDIELAEKIMQNALEQFSAIRYDFMDAPVTFSYGSAQYDRAENSVTLFDRADQVMYGRKRAFHEREKAAAEKNAETGA